MAEENNRDKQIIDQLNKILRNLEALIEHKDALLAAREREIRNLIEEINMLRQEYANSLEENDEALRKIEERTKKLLEKVQALTSSPIHVGKLVALAKGGRVKILDNHRTLYEVLLSPDIDLEGLQEGMEVHYTVDQSGKPQGVFAVQKARREEEIRTITMVNEVGKTAFIVSPGDVPKAVNVGRKVEKLEKGDEVYYDPVINCVVGMVPKTKEKSDLRNIEKKTWADVGGLRNQVQKVREVIELPLKHPELFKKLGISRPKGILMSGPPGCGKTLIAKILANEAGVFFVSMSGPEFISPYPGEAEAKLRNLFAVARKNAPAIVFLDEVEAISEKRDEAEHGHERRLVSQLLSLMDGLDSTEQVVVIAATNKPNLLDEALRRPGRFDREIEIPIPDEQGRLEILGIHAKNMPLAKDVFLEDLAKSTHGFTGADLEGLCKEAGMLVLREADREKIGYFPLKLEVELRHFNSVLGEIKPSVMREVIFQKPTETWADVGGLENVKKRMEEAIKWPLFYPELLKAANQKPIRGVLLYGPPGSGKTLLARALANECGINFIPVKGPELLNKYVGESEANVRKIFKRARQSAPCVIFFDEIDALVSMRGMHFGDAGVSDKVTAQLLTEFDGIEELKGVFILAATNRLDLVDPALLRPGRLDYLIRIPPPDDEARLKIFEIHTKNMPLAQDVDLKKLVAKTKHVQLTASIQACFTGAGIANICQKAAQKALREFIESCDNPEKESRNFQIHMRHFEQVMEENKFSVEVPVRKNKNFAAERKPVRRPTDKDLRDLVS